MSLHSAKVIDVHAHIILAETFGAAGRLGPEMGGQDGDKPWFRVGDYRLDGVRYQNSAFMDIDLRLQRMAQAEIDFQVLSPNPLTFLHFIDSLVATRFCQTHNDSLSKVVCEYSTYFLGLAALPMQDISAACDELTRAVTELGLTGGYIGTDLPYTIADPAMDGLYETCSSLNVPLFFHPSPAGIDGPTGDTNLRDFDLDVIIGFAAQEALVIARLIYGGVLDRHPDLDICVSHGGGSTGYLIGRMAMASRKRPWASAELKADGAFEERLSRLWFDNHLNNDNSLEMLTNIVGDDQLVFGTNFSGWDAPDDLNSHLPSPKLAKNSRRLLRAQS